MIKIKIKETPSSTLTKSGSNKFQYLSLIPPKLHNLKQIKTAQNSQFNSFAKIPKD